MKASTLVTLCLLLLAGRPGADPVLDQAREKEKAGDFEASASLLASWLSANPGAAGSASVFADYVRVEQDFPLLLQRAASFLKTSRGLPGCAQQFEVIARLFDLAGRVEEARDAYLAARMEGAPDSALISAFLLSLRVNDADAMSASLQQLAGSSGSARILLKALSDLKGGDRVSARTALVGLADQTGNPDLALKALWVLYESASESGDQAGQAAAREKMKQRFALSPETALTGEGSADPASRRSVVSAPAPGLLDSGTQSLATPLGTPATVSPQPTVDQLPAAPPAVGRLASPPAATAPVPAASTPEPAPAAALPTDAPTTTPSPPASTAASPTRDVAPPSAPLTAAITYSVQAGSFGMKENADDLSVELTRRGFPVSVVRDVSQGKERFRVFAGTGMEMDGAEAVLDKLVAAGFSGFLVRDR